MRLAPILLLSLTLLAPFACGAIESNGTPSSTGLADTSPQSFKHSGITPWKPRPVLGGQKTLILLVQFPDVRFRSSIQEIRSLVDVVDRWFRKSSYEKTYIDYTIHEEILTLPNTVASYGAPLGGNERGDDPYRADAYIVDTVDLVIAQEIVDLREYKHLVLIHAGGDEANTGNPNDIWSYCDCVGPIADEDPQGEASWVLYDESGRITHAFWGVSTFSEDEPWAVFAHEYTHSLGVSDLYVYGPDGYSEGPGIGFWSNMAAGGTLDPPADIDGWSKYILGWVEAITVDSPQGEYVIHTLDSADEPKALLMRIGANEDEYYFVHARRKASTDAALPSEGVIVFKINRLFERSLRGNELATISDANPETPQECSFYMDPVRELCEPLDAPYNEKQKEYPFTYYSLSVNIVLNDDIFWAQDAGMGFRVQPVGLDAFKITMSGSVEELGITTPTTITTPTQPAQCVVATAAFGSEMAPDVVYMRFVRDRLIGSTHVGGTLVRAFNVFYYSWSPPIAQAIASSWLLRVLFRILLHPLVWIVHATALLFIAIVGVAESADVASIVAFAFAASASVAVYVAVPLLLSMKLMQAIRKTRGRRNAPTKLS